VTEPADVARAYFAAVTAPRRQRDSGLLRTASPSRSTSSLGGRHIAVGDFFTIDGDKIRRLVTFFGHELS
jgi:hypothetical protein